MKKISLITFLAINLNATVNALSVYQFVDLGNLSVGGASMAYSINNQNQIAGSAFDSLGNERAVMWESGVIRDLGFNGVARAINNRGEIVGDSQFGLLKRAFHWQNNIFTQFTTLKANQSGNSYGFDINDSGVVVGVSETDYTGGGQSLHGFKATQSAGLTDLGTNGPQNGYSRAHGINAQGDIVGRGAITTFNGSDKHSIHWAPDGSVEVKFPVDRPTPRYGVSEDINNFGQAVVIERFGNAVGLNRTYIWDVNSDSFQFLGNLSGYNQSYGIALNDSGLVVGYADKDTIGSGLEPSPESEPVAFIYSAADGGMINLNSLILGQMAADGWVLNVAYDINAQGSIVGMGTFNGEYRAFMLQSVAEVPLPGAFIFGISSLFSLLILKFRKILKK